MGYNHDTRENWEKNFTGLERFDTVGKDLIKEFEESAKELGMRFEYKKMGENSFDVYCEPDQDLTEFWDKMK